MLYLITYDLNAPGQRYQELYDTLKSWGAQRVLLSTWVLRRAGALDTTKMVNMLRVHLIDANDRLLVTEMTTNWATYNAMVDINTIQ